MTWHDQNQYTVVSGEHLSLPSCKSTINHALFFTQNHPDIMIRIDQTKECQGANATVRHLMTQICNYMQRRSFMFFQESFHGMFFLHNFDLNMDKVQVCVTFAITQWQASRLKIISVFFVLKYLIYIQL